MDENKSFTKYRHNPSRVTDEYKIPKYKMGTTIYGITKVFCFIIFI